MKDYLYSQIKGLKKPIVLIISIVILLSAVSCGTTKVYKIGILCGLEYLADITEGFKSKMTELGYQENKNIIYDVQKSNIDMDAYKKILKKFVDDKVDLILTFPSEATYEAKPITEGTNIPVIFTFAFIDNMNIIKSVQEPGGNLSGVRFPGPDLAIKRFEVLKQIAPNAKKIFIPYQKGYPIVGVQMDALKPVAAASGVTFEECPVNDAAELKKILAERSKSSNIGMDAILFIVEPLMVSNEPFEIVGQFAYQHKLPMGGAIMDVNGYSSLYGIQVGIKHSGEQVAPYADKVLKGTPIGTIPVISSDVIFQINYKAAQQLGIQIPENLLKEADEVIR